MFDVSVYKDMCEHRRQRYRLVGLARRIASFCGCILCVPIQGHVTHMLFKAILCCVFWTAWTCGWSSVGCILLNAVSLLCVSWLWGSYHIVFVSAVSFFRAVWHASLQLIVKAQSLLQTTRLYDIVNPSYVPLGPAEVWCCRKLFLDLFLMYWGS